MSQADVSDGGRLPFRAAECGVRVRVRATSGGVR